MLLYIKIRQEHIQAGQPREKPGLGSLEVRSEAAPFGLDPQRVFSKLANTLVQLGEGDFSPRQITEATAVRILPFPIRRRPPFFNRLSSPEQLAREHSNPAPADVGGPLLTMAHNHAGSMDRLGSTQKTGDKRHKVRHMEYRQ